MGQEGRDGISNLLVLLRPWPLKKVIIGKRLYTGRLTNRETPTLFRVIMDKVMPIFGYMRGDGRRGPSSYLDAETIIKLPGFERLGDVFMFRQYLSWEVIQHWGTTVNSRERSRKKIAMEVFCKMSPGRVVADR